MSEIKMIPLGKIIITGDNPRTEFNLDSLNDFATSAVVGYFSGYFSNKA